MTGFPKQPGHFVSTDDGREAAWGDCHPTAPATPARRFRAPALAAIIVALVAWDIHVLRTNGDPSAALLGRGISRVALGQAGIQSRGEPEFDLSNVTVPAKEIRGGGPPKDGIPAIATPKLIAAAAAPLRPDDRVVGIVSGDDARAYPLNILNYHEIVNDRIGDTPVAVTYCPLCDSVVAFDRRTPLGEREFGVSGLLYNSNVLMYDRGGRPESLWSQLATSGISGPAAGKSLRTIPVELTTWREWQARHPATQVLSTDTGHQRDYDRNPYERYFTQPGLMFPAKPRSNRLPTKERVLGVWTSEAARCYPESAFSRDRTRVEDTVGKTKVVIAFNPDTKSLRVEAADDGVQWMYSLWFAWHAFRPGTTIFE